MGNTGLARLVCLASALAALSGCAVTEERYRPSLNALVRHFAPSTAAGSRAAWPVGLPVSLLAPRADAFVIHPATVFDDAWRDTREWLWTPDPSESRFRTVVLFPLRVLATPLIYLGDWASRAAFAIDPHEVPPASE